MSRPRCALPSRASRSRQTPRTRLTLTRQTQSCDSNLFYTLSAHGIVRKTAYSVRRLSLFIVGVIRRSCSDGVVSEVVRRLSALYDEVVATMLLTKSYDVFHVFLSALSMLRCAETRLISHGLLKIRLLSFFCVISYFTDICHCTDICNYVCSVACKDSCEYFRCIEYSMHAFIYIVCSF